MDTEHKLLIWHDNLQVRKYYQEDVIKFIADNAFGVELRSDQNGKTVEIYGRYNNRNRFVPINNLLWYR